MQVIVSHMKARGDTLIEVLFATAIFSLIAVGGLAIMNQGLSAAQRSLEITLVRNEMDAQAAALRFMNASYISVYQPGAATYITTAANQWKSISDIKNETSASNLAVGTICPATSSNLRLGSFIVNTKTASSIRLTPLNYKPASTFSQINYDNDTFSSADGIWIEPVSSAAVNVNNQDNTGYIDFHIRACWDSPGQATPVTLGTIVRLYEPR